MKIIGLDAGSVSVKAVVLDAAGAVLKRYYQKHKGHPVQVALEILKTFGNGEECSIAVTGSAGKLIAGILGIEPVNEIVARPMPHGNYILIYGPLSRWAARTRSLS